MYKHIFAVHGHVVYVQALKARKKYMYVGMRSISSVTKTAIPYIGFILCIASPLSVGLQISFPNHHTYQLIMYWEVWPSWDETWKIQISTNKGLAIHSTKNMDYYCCCFILILSHWALLILMHLPYMHLISLPLMPVSTLHALASTSEPTCTSPFTL